MLNSNDIIDLLDEAINVIGLHSYDDSLCGVEDETITKLQDMIYLLNEYPFSIGRAN